ncbi:hypothetical protein LCGC14_3155640, partial [marine sediment metagenome]
FKFRSTQNPKFGQARKQFPALNYVSLSTNVLGEFLGVDGVTIRNWLGVLNEPTFKFGGVGGSGDHDLVFRRIRSAIRNHFKFSQTSSIRFFLEQAFSRYTEEYYSDLDFIESFLDIMDDYVKSPYTQYDISTVFNPGDDTEGKGYIGKLKDLDKKFKAKKASNDDAVSTVDKYFKFLTQVLLIEKEDFDFIDANKIKDFRSDITDLVYDTISSPPYNLIRATTAGKAQFNAISNTLYAINKAREALPMKERQKFITDMNPRGLFTLTDLSRAVSDKHVSPEAARKLIANQLKAGLPTLQLSRATHLLQEGRLRAIEDTEIAINQITKYVEEEGVNA